MELKHPPCGEASGPQLIRGSVHSSRSPDRQAAALVAWDEICEPAPRILSSVAGAVLNLSCVLLGGSRDGSHDLFTCRETQRFQAKERRGTSHPQ